MSGPRQSFPPQIMGPILSLAEGVVGLACLCRLHNPSMSIYHAIRYLLLPLYDMLYCTC